MDKITIEYLDDIDFEGISYKAVFKNLSSRLTYKCKTYENFEKCFNDLGAFEKDTIVTILSHGFKDRGISTGTWESFITWAELLNIISSKKGNPDSADLQSVPYINPKLLTHLGVFYCQLSKQTCNKNLKKIKMLQNW